jgi:hypothetical protein
LERTTIVDREVFEKNTPPHGSAAIFAQTIPLTLNAFLFDLVDFLKNGMRISSRNWQNARNRFLGLHKVTSNAEQQRIQPIF